MEDQPIQPTNKPSNQVDMPDADAYYGDDTESDEIDMSFLDESTK